MNSKSIYTITIAFTAAIGGFLLGFDGSVISGAAPFYKTFFHLNDSSFLFGFSVSCIIWGSVFGNLFAGKLSDRFGRKPVLILSALLFLISSLITALAGDITVFIIGRIMAGFAVGIAILLAPVYIAEISPPGQRGWLVSFNQLLIVIGLSAAYFSNYVILNVVHDPLLNWRWMLGIEAFPSIVYFLLLFFIPESPRWLMMKNKDKKAIHILSLIGGPAHSVKEYEEIKGSLAHHKSTTIVVQAREFFSSKMRLILIIGFGLAIFQQLSGINAVLYYAPMIFESAGGGRGSAFIQAVVLGIVFMVMTIGSMFFIDRLGRRPLLFTGVGIMAVSLLLTGLAFRADVHTNSRLILICILGFIAGFSISLGPVMWAIFSEIFPNHLRGFAISAVGVANSMSSFIVATFFPLQLARFGSSNTYFIYAGFMFFCLWFIWKYVMETKGKSLEEIENQLIRAK